MQILKFLPIIIFIPFLSNAKEQVIMLHAGSLAKPFAELEAIFELENPSVDLVREVSGSKLAIRKFLELKKEADIIALADSNLIEEFLIPEHASWVINFARNSIVIVFTDVSKYREVINSKNWPSILMKNDVEVGHSDPLLDPCGYRALLVMKLAEEYYNMPGLYNMLNSKIPQKNIRPKETDLVALAEAGELDYHFNYRSVAEQHNLKYIELPEEINLGSVKFRQNYEKASIELNDRGKKITIRGTPILLGLTIPLSAKNPEYAKKFITLLLSDRGTEILRKNRLQPLEPPDVQGEREIPEAILKKARESH